MSSNRGVSEMTYGELLQQAPSEERIEYVYMWLYKTEEGDMPFYVGIGRNGRYKDRSSRSKAFKDFLATHECYSIKCAIDLTDEVARVVEKKLKEELRMANVVLIDAEDCEPERKKRQREGIDAMPVVNGKRVSVKTGRAYGRPSAVSDAEFEKFFKKQKDGTMTVSECCRELGISRVTWYNRVASAQ